MMHNEKVQKWVNSLPVEHGDDVHENIVSEDGFLSHNSNNGKSADDMSLGAEAKSVMLTGDGSGESSSTECLNKDSELTNGMVEPADKFRFLGGTCNGGRDAAVQLLRQRFRTLQQDSFNSESSSHLTTDSIDHLLWERRGDPEKILENLGFVGKVVDRRRRIPERFLKNSSKANGISVEKFLENNPWLKDYLEQKAAMAKPFEAITMNTNSEPLEETTEVESEVENVTGKKMTAFHQVASTVAMIHRFRSLVRHLNAGEPEVEPLVEPILRNSSRGPKYWSILTPDNYNFLDQMGYYDMRFEKPSKKGLSRFNTAASKLVKQMSVSGQTNVLQETAINGHTDDELHIKQNEKLDKILRLRSSAATEKGKEKVEKVPEKVESPVLKDSRFSVPERFLTSRSLLFGTAQQLTGECVSELVRKGSDSNFNMSDVPDLCLTSSNNIVSTTDSNVNTAEDLPIIAISPFSKSSTVESFDYEWQRNSVSSTGTEDSSLLDYDDRAVVFDDNPRMDFLGLTIDDVGWNSLRVPSDAASVLSSHTLREHENVDHSSDQDTCTDTLQMSNDSLSLLRNDGGIPRFNSSEEAPDQEDGINDLSSQLNKKKNVSGDHLPPVLNFSSKLKGVLRRQGSSQSDSSGFVDSDHLDSSFLPDSYYPNKVRYTNRQTKLDTISSQDSTSLDESSDYFHSPESIFSPSADQNFDNKPANRIRILKGDYRNEFWSTKHSVETQTGWDCLPYSTEDPSRLPLELTAESEALMKEKFLSQPEIYTTRLYIDSLLPRTSVPLVERAEVMVILDGCNRTCKSRPDDEDSQLQSVYHVSSVDVDVIKTKDGDQILTPILFSSGKTATVKNQTLDGEQRLSHRRQRTIELDLADKDSLQNDVFDSSLKATVTRGKSLQLDFSDHQILHSLLKQSIFISPQCAAALLPPSHWSALGDTEISQKQHLLEEVKLLQHALQKYRLEIRVLQMQAKKLYMNESSSLISGEGDSLFEVEELHDAIFKELDSLDTQLSQRMKLAISLSPHELSLGFDLSCLSIVKQMTELLREQIYHGNVISGMSVILPSCVHSVSGVTSYVRNSEEDLLLEKITSLEKKMEEQNKLFEACLANAMQQMQEVMQHQRQFMTTELSKNSIRSAVDKS